MPFLKSARIRAICCVYGRYTIGEQYDGSALGKLYMGQVKHISVLRENTLLCVEWFKTGDLSDEQRDGLKIIPVSIMEQDQMWIDAADVVVQQHILLQPDVKSKSFHVVIKI